MLAEFNLQCLFQKCSNTFNRSFGWTCSRVVQCWLGCGSFQWNPKCTRALCFGGRTCSIHIGNCNTSSWSGNFIAQKTCSSSWASNITQWEAYVFGSALWTSLCSIHFPICPMQDIQLKHCGLFMICYMLFWMKLSVYNTKRSWVEISIPNCMSGIEAIFLMSLHICGGYKSRIMKTTRMTGLSAARLGWEKQLISFCTAWMLTFWNATFRTHLTWVQIIELCMPNSRFPTYWLGEGACTKDKQFGKTLTPHSFIPELKTIWG